MLQRIQTVFMSIAALCGIALYFTANDAVVLDSNIMIHFGGVVSFLLIVFSIMNFKNRKRQLVLNTISIMINALLIGLLLYWLLHLSGGIDFPEKGIEPIFPFVALFCLFVANLYIRKDERLVKSVDRLR